MSGRHPRLRSNMCEGHADWDEWDHEVFRFVERHLPSPPCRVLDVGCGDGWLVRALRERGYVVRGVDPQAPEGDPSLISTRLEDFESAEPFDAIVAVLPLHHVEDLDLAIARIRDLSTPDGLFLCVEFAWDRFDDPTARWCLEHLPAELDDGNWLHELCAPLRRRQLRDEALHTGEIARRWASEHGFHSSAEILGRLRGPFTRERIEWEPYLYPDLGVTSDTERAAISRKQIAATGFRFVGRTSSVDPPRA